LGGNPINKYRGVNNIKEKPKGNNYTIHLHRLSKNPHH
jgi:hypothetical protein